MGRLRWFWLLAPLVTAILVWASLTALAKERQANESRHYWSRRAEVQRIVDRLDGHLTVLLTRESGLPASSFGSFTTGLPVGSQAAAPRLPSPLLRPAGLPPAEQQALAGPLAERYHPGSPSPGLARLYFELRDTPAGPARRLPAAPQGAERELAIDLGLTTPATLARVEALADELDARIPRERLRRLAAGDSSSLVPGPGAGRGFTPVLFSVPDAAAPSGETAELLFLRLVPAPEGRRLQGIWFDWPALEAQLLALGSAELERGSLALGPSRQRLVDGVALPYGASAAAEQDGHLGTLALDVQVVGRPPLARTPFTATGISLLAALLVFLGALAALYLFLRRSIELAERRTRFASAVTHELRTPLTTLCMYAELLEAGLVKEPEQVAAYHATLKRESLRLAALVDNVLSHAGLGERGAVAVEPVDVAALLTGLVPRLEARCQRGDLAGAEAAGSGDAFVLEGAELPAGLAVRADPQGLERVLVNLVDNACKYGAAPVRLALEVADERLHLRVSDAGPGVPPEHRRRLFAAYERGAAEAAGDRASRTEGLGLGLSLARDLCRAMGGELELEHPGPGTAPVTAKQGATRMLPPTTFHLHLALA